jgi:hypothetical protein
MRCFGITIAGGTECDWLSNKFFRMHLAQGHWLTTMSVFTFHPVGSCSEVFAVPLPVRFFTGQPSEHLPPIYATGFCTVNVAAL